AGLPVTKRVDPDPAVTGDEFDQVTYKFNPARVIKETVTMWRNRELVPFFKRLTSRVADRSADYDPPVTRDGEEYRYWLDEADPELVRRELGVDLEELKRQDDQARELAAAQARPELPESAPEPARE